MANVTLTFDNGPEVEVTPHVLDVLAAHDIRASFFVVGKKLESDAARACAVRARDAGHWIGNHTYSHSVSLGEAPEGAFDAEVVRTQEIMGDLVHADGLFRPYCNSGVLDHRVFKPSDVLRLEQGGFTCVLFNGIARDWEDGEGWPERAMTEIRSRAWTTLVLHDIPRVNAMRHLDSFIKRVRDEGHSFVQDFSPDTVPIRRGERLLPIDSCVNDGTMPC